jgi:hypothetical protein
MSTLSIPHIRITRRDLLVMLSREVESHPAVTAEDKKTFGRMLGDLLEHPVIASSASSDFTAALKAISGI